MSTGTSISPVRSAVRFCGYLLRGRIHFPKDRRGEIVTNLDDQHVKVVMQAIVDPTPAAPVRPGGLFRVRFHLKHMSPAANRWFLHLPVPLIVGLPGFRSKLWLYDEETGDFQGRYEWNTVEDAQRYADSVALRFMRRRSVPGSVSFSVTPNEG